MPSNYGGSAYEALTKTLSERQHASLAVLQAGAKELAASQAAQSKYARVLLRHVAHPAVQDYGWIVGSSREAGETFSVVLTSELLLAAGKLAVRHDATTESTVHITTDPLSIADLLARYEDEKSPILGQDTARGGMAYTAIGHVLCQPPEALERNIDLILNPCPRQ